MHPGPIISLMDGKINIYLYGICMALGIVLCFIFLFLTMRRQKFNEASADAVIFIGIFGTGFGIFSAMLFQATYNYIANPSGGFDLGGSMTFIGGLIGGVLSFVGVWNLYMFVIRKRTKFQWLKPEMNAGLTDALPFIPIGITIAHAFGRFGCFWAGCCYGEKTDAWFGMYVAQKYNSTLGTTYLGDKVIPTQLFEMIFLILLTVVMAVLFFKFKFNYNFAVYAISYGIWRFIIEFYRGDFRGTLFGNTLSPSQIWSLVMVPIGVGYIFVQKYFFAKLMLHPELQEKPEEHTEPEESSAPAEVTE